ncbi:4Fe-4S ferredoxin [Aestuariivirga litoralis]|uniref:4Fe-4S ferredoxin n=1 Tax=Aestuariivirga litoralis TaxID=2650924 RepID=A0A2W2ATR1_9HYPH|nr:SCP2 sterol-binding domain-containing protein [Aestuariivirga litoralis]PZF75930.1 4Fe-4S ferredoxin [Aestuariivirga litoralis]
MDMAVIEQKLTAQSLNDLARSLGADDSGVVSIDDPLLEEDRPFILRAFPAARTLIVLLGRMHREPVRSPARSVANLEFHSAGHAIDETARAVVRHLEDRGIRALNPAMAFPMELDSFPERGWIVSYKRAAEAAGLGRMGIHRNLIHPTFGNFVLLGGVLVAEDVAEHATPIDFNPCMECKLCVAACPVGAIKSDGYFDFSACMNHNYQQFMGGFANFVEDIADSGSAAAFRQKNSYSETVSRWQSLSYGPNYNAAYCMAVCPAGTDVIGPYQASKAQYLKSIVDPLQKKEEPVYVVKGSDAADYVAKRFPHKRQRFVRSSLKVTSVNGFLGGMRHVFQPGKAKGLNAVYHFIFTGSETRSATVSISNGRLTVDDGLSGLPDITIRADARGWVRFLAKEISLVRFIATGGLRIRGKPSLLAAFGKCFPS